MWQDIREVYTNAWRAVFLLPLVFLIPALVEFTQHLVELTAGLYESRAAAKVAGDDPLRMMFGFAKALSITFPGYWLVRLMAFEDRTQAARIEFPAFGLWLALFALSAIETALSMFGPSPGAVLGLNETLAKIVGPTFNGAWSILGIYLTAWTIAWPLGNRAIGPIRSVKLMAGSFWQTVVYALLCGLPLMAVHYGLGYFAILFAPAWLDWPLLVLDSLVVAWLACTMAGGGFVAARHATQRRSVPLLPI